MSDDNNPNKYTHNETTKQQKSWDVKDPKVIADPNPKQRVDLQVADFDTLLQQKGVNFLVYRTSYCPNVKSVDGAEHEIDCPLCNGSGWIDVNPIKVLGFIKSQETERLLNAEGGQHDGNSIFITFPIGVEMQYFTLVQLCDYTQIYFQRVLRKPGSNIDILKYKACRVNFIKDKLNNDYYQEQDFKIDPNGNIQWLARKPADNTPYTINYECHVQFRATRAMHVSRFTQYKPAGDANVEFMKLPEEWMFTKEFMVRRRDLVTGNDLIPGPFGNWQNTTGDND